MTKLVVTMLFLLLLVGHGLAHASTIFCYPMPNGGFYCIGN